MTGEAKVKIQVEEYQVLDPGLYSAKFVSIEEKDSQNGTYWRWTFEATLPDGDVQVVTANSSAKLTAATKAGQWVKTLRGGHKLEPGETVDFDGLAGARCQLNIDTDETDRGTFNRIEAVLPAPPVSADNTPF